VPRKSAVVTVDQAKVEEVMEQVRALAEIRGEIAQAAYEHQDKATQAVIERIRDTLRVAATGYVEITVDPPHGAIVPVKLEQRYVDFNLLYVAVDILKTLAIFDVRIENFEFPPSHCTNCGAEIEYEALAAKRSKAGRKRKRG
jgi:hypothetical protein